MVCISQVSYLTGINDFKEFKSYTATKKTRILALLHVSRPGLTRAGCVTDGKTVRQWSCHAAGILSILLYFYIH